MKFNPAKILGWFFIFAMLLSLILYFVHQNMDYRFVQLAALLSLFMQLQSACMEEAKEDEGEE